MLGGHLEKRGGMLGPTTHQRHLDVLRDQLAKRRPAQLIPITATTTFMSLNFRSERRGQQTGWTLCAATLPHRVKAMENTCPLGPTT
jgi:hypothetical protein